ncbi:MAG: hypothetical protein AAGI23_01400 [Bacteroidota bacterium]
MNHIFLILFSLIGLSATCAQSDLKVIKARLTTSYSELQVDGELHGCCQYFPADNLRASSSLKTQSKNTYDVTNLGDNGYESAWIEGISGDGIGEYIEFEYSYDIKYKGAADGGDLYEDEWNFLNGYQKNLTTWRNNGRIHTMKMYINGLAYCMIELLDRPGVQAVDLGFMEYLEQQKGTIHIKLVIESVYQGEKFSDTALSEIVW